MRSQETRVKRLESKPSPGEAAFLKEWDHWKKLSDAARAEMDAANESGDEAVMVRAWQQVCRVPRPPLTEEQEQEHRRRANEMTEEEAERIYQEMMRAGRGELEKEGQ